MFSVGVIVPTWHYFADPFKLQPLNELYYATIIDERLSDDGVSVEVIDLRQVRKDYGVFNEQLLGLYVPEYDLYMYWIAKSADYYEIEKVVNNLRKRYPNARHAAGGTHVDNFPQDCKEVFDAIVLGPGEESFIKIIRQIRNGKCDKVHQDDWKNIHYNDYPYPNRRFLPESAILNDALFKKYGGLYATSAMFSRGCNFKCAYCVYNIPHTIQMRSPENIEAEIEYLKREYAIEAINLRDEICIPLSRKVAEPYLQVMAESGLIWRGQTRVGAPKDIIETAKQAGCVELAVGVESVSQEVLDFINKGQSVGQAGNFLLACREVGIKTKMCLILGLPGEPADIVEKTIRFIEEFRPDYVNVSGFCPVPGSIIFDNPGYYGIKYIDTDWSRHAHLLCRFSDEEDEEYFGLPFEYDEDTQWGKAFSRNEIIENIKQVQHYLQERLMAY